MAVSRTNLQREYLMEEVVAGVLDDTGLDNQDGTVTGATAVQGVNDRSHCLTFDNANAGAAPSCYVAIPQWSRDNGQAHSISAWVNLDVTAAKTLCGWAASGGTGTPSYAFRVTPTGALEITFDHSTFYQSTSNVGLSTGTWFHCAFRRTYANLEFFVNGVKLGNTVTTPSSSGFYLYNIGVSTRATSYYDHLQGDVQFFRVYNRALTDEEMLELYYEGFYIEPADGISDSVGDVPSLEQQVIITGPNGISESVGDIPSIDTYYLNVGSSISESISRPVIVLSQVHSLTVPNAISDSIGDIVQFITIIPHKGVSESVGNQVTLQYLVTQANFVGDMTEDEGTLTADWNIGGALLSESDTLAATILVTQLFDFSGEEEGSALTADFNIVGRLIEAADVLDATFTQTVNWSGALISGTDSLSAVLTPTALFVAALTEAAHRLAAELDDTIYFAAVLTDLTTGQLDAIVIAGTVFVAETTDNASELEAEFYLEAQFVFDVTDDLCTLNADFSNSNRFASFLLQYSRW